MKIEELYSDIEINPADTIVFGCSYGPDSMALFKSLLMLREKCRIHLVCAHVHHGKRRESDDEKIALEADRVITIDDGKIVSDELVG